jgi:Na+/glutamate symporter
MARLLGLHPVLGLVAGSITLVGGHGTGAAYAERFAKEHDILGVMGLTMTSATIGLVIGGIIGGPVAERLIRRIPRTEKLPSADGGAVRLAGPLLIILAAQTVLVAAWATCVMFKIIAGDYESAVIAGAFCGFAMGATATAVANMQALARRYGPAPQAFVVVPIVGAFFIDLMNLAVLTFFLLPGFVVGR